MPSADAAPAKPKSEAVKLSFGPTLRAAFRTVFGSFGAFLKLAVVPFLLSGAILLTDFSLRAMALVGSLPFDPDGWAAALLDTAIFIVGLLPLTFLGIMITRLSLGAPQSGVVPSPVLGRRTWIFAGYFLLLSVIFIFPTVGGIALGVAVLQTGGFSDEVGPAAMALGGIAGFAVLLYIILRLSLVLPTVVLDERLSLAGSWRLTRHGGLKLLGVFLMFLPVAILMMIVGSLAVGNGTLSIGTPELVVPEGTPVLPDGTLVGISWQAILLANIPRSLWNLVANFLLFALACGALASAFAQLTGWGGPRAEILERFE